MYKDRRIIDLTSFGRRTIFGKKVEFSQGPPRKKDRVSQISEGTPYPELETI